MARFELDPAFVKLHEAAGGQIGETERGLLLHNQAAMSYVVSDVDGVFRVGISEKHEEPREYCAGSDLVAVQRQLVAEVGSTYRSFQRMQRIALPWREDEVKDGYTVIPVDDYGFTLERSDGSRVPFAARSDSSSAIVRYSHVADLPIGDLVASYMDPSAYPLFPYFLKSGF